MKTPGLLVEPGWVAEHLYHPGVRIIDVRWSPTGRTAVAQRLFEDGHIPGAAFLDIDRDLSGTPFQDGPGRHPLPTPSRFADTMARCGVDDEMYLVVYDDMQGSVAARLWWMLWDTGRQVSMLDGGLKAWVDDGGKLERGPAEKRETTLFSTVPWPGDRVVGADAVEVTLNARSAPVIDVRAAERYRGETEPFDPVAGHIPGALSAPWTGNLDPTTGKFLSPEKLRERYAALGVTGDATVCHCGSGVNACHALFALRLAGFGDARLYSGSWSDWVHRGNRPVATGPEPGGS
jgi:thiosulfate/3-mercaptopyruvate sulfurtransferase